MQRLFTAGSFLALAALLLAACDRAEEPQPVAAAATFVGNDACAGCHTDETEAWRGSHHDAAMQAALPSTVLGDFDDAAFTHDGLTTTFRREGERFIVNTEGSDGELTDFEVAYTFGVEPLQQYLVETDNGRLQALTIAWDARPAEQGGQRWFHLLPEEPAPPGDPLHWSGVGHNWNASCAECHSTDLAKSYDAERDGYATTWSGIDVGCEACHGPGSSHAAAPAAVDLPLAAVARAWVLAGDGPIAARVPAERPQQEIETCAACHSRRSQLSDGLTAGTPFLDSFKLALLDEPLYHPDGQILEEVFEYGSFLQSKMHAAGVTCSDCHDPHSARLRAEGNAVCGQCHAASTFEAPSHHRHPPGTAGAQCVACHMPAETYMVIDPRHDHGFRVPRPDLSLALGTPNACTACHNEQGAAWAAEQVAAWYPDGHSGRFHFGEAIAAGREWRADRRALLLRVIESAEFPPIARATALGLLAEQPEDFPRDALRAALASGESLLELAALDALTSFPEEWRIELAQRFLDHELLALRIAAAEALMPVRSGLTASRRSDLDAAVAELRSAHAFNLDRPEGLLGLANLELANGAAEAALRSLERAVERHPYYLPAYANLADLHRAFGREQDAERILREGLERAPASAELTHALGLTLVRTGRASDALPLLERASALAPEVPRYAYVYGVALNSTANPGAALDFLGAVHERFPGHAATLVALATMSRDAGRRDDALGFTRALAELSPAHPLLPNLFRELE